MGFSETKFPESQCWHVLHSEPTAWIIGHPKNENLIKGLSIVVFLIGFYFDLLAS